MNRSQTERRPCHRYHQIEHRLSLPVVPHGFRRHQRQHGLPSDVRCDELLGKVRQQIILRRVPAPVNEQIFPSTIRADADQSKNSGETPPAGNGANAPMPYVRPAVGARAANGHAGHRAARPER